MSSIVTDNKGIPFAVRRWFWITYHRLANVPLTWRGTLIRVVVFALLISPPALLIWARSKQLSWTYIVVSLVGVVVAAYQKLRPDFDSLAITTMTNIEVAAIMRRTYRPFTGVERKEFQQRLLIAIANQVRSLRNDSKGTRIYANLLVRDRKDPNKIVVVARSHVHAGEDRAEYRLDEMAVRSCFLLGDSVEVGDIWAEFPKADRTKRYRSILGIPLKSVEYDSPEVIGVLSIDSSEQHNFAKWETQLINTLLPLTTILELTMERPR
ncbi:MAG TPA: hypothetical protein VGQ21_18245 [Thermoanaerobaculia bacterium]|nr:hypothetical protein [Thermoanaerobaculia bacterium]